ncbi:PREDICTED: structural maintenance of chromosomes protein 5-like [Priapulus caudatus]|uniref:Structural maintenance of chromosomes protein 5 n=1 Tax=Priapulus caudatus TaxID=37621 RepID=A0ABM1E3A4_PRICU|nr:PREDICTED: structural maintenance of chromosomes protein 5-like [Priapulus caudatus]
MPKSKNASNKNGDKGSIARIKLKNFLTYDSVEFNPGAHLNVIIGPNGTGKSSIVCAICLGLGGKTQYMGRATEVGDFIKHGCDYSEIEIELCNTTGPNYVIKRVINPNNQSTWILNGQQTTHKNIDEVTKKLNIQVGNLCQFLPQEKVADFVKMTQQELLENTEKAVGPPDMFENHQKLKDSRSKARDLELSYRNLNEYLSSERQKNVRLETDVQSFHDRHRHLERVTLLTQKRGFLEYERCRQRFTEATERRHSLKKRSQEAEADTAPLRLRLEVVTNEKDSLETKIRNKTVEMRPLAEKAQRFVKSIETLNDKVSGETVEMRPLAEKAQRFVKSIETLTTSVSDG